MSDKELLEFNYTVVEFNDENLQFELQFENPDLVSQQIEKDNLLIRLDNFRDDQEELIAKDQMIKKVIPSQMSEGEAQKV